MVFLCAFALHLLNITRYSNFGITGNQLSSVAQSCLTLCDPMNSSMAGLPVHHQLPKFTQTHVHWVGDAIEPSHLLLSPSPSALNISQIRVFSNESVLCIRLPKYWSFNFSIRPSNEYSGLSMYVPILELYAYFFLLIGIFDLLFH